MYITSIYIDLRCIYQVYELNKNISVSPRTETHYVQCASGSGPKQRDCRGTCRSPGMEYAEQGVEHVGELLSRIAQ